MLPLVLYGPGHFPQFSQQLFYPYVSPEENREAHRRLGEWWAWKRYHARFDRCCHGKPA